MQEYQEYKEIGGKLYPVKGYVKSRAAGRMVPVLEIKWMSDIKWQREALADRFRRPQNYETFQNVPESIARLEKWLTENDPDYPIWCAELDREMEERKARETA